MRGRAVEPRAGGPDRGPRLAAGQPRKVPGEAQGCGARRDGIAPSERAGPVVPGDPAREEDPFHPAIAGEDRSRRPPGQLGVADGHHGERGAELIRERLKGADRRGFVVDARTQLGCRRQEFGGEPVRLALQPALPVVEELTRRFDPLGAAREHGVQVAVDVVVPEFVREGEAPVPRGRAGVGDDDAEPVALLPERPVDPGGKGPFLDGEPLPAGDPDGIDRDGGDAQVGEEVGRASPDLALARAHFFFGSSRSSSASTTRTA